MQIKNKAELVKKLLQKNPHLRDDDNKLIATIWWNEIKKAGTDPSPYKPLLDMFAQGKLSNPESIRRVRQKLQENESELRGNMYSIRHKEQEKVKSELKYI